MRELVSEGVGYAYREFGQHGQLAHAIPDLAGLRVYVRLGDALHAYQSGRGRGFELTNGHAYVKKESPALGIQAVVQRVVAQP